MAGGKGGRGVVIFAILKRCAVVTYMGRAAPRASSPGEGSRAHRLVAGGRMVGAHHNPRISRDFRDTTILPPWQKDVAECPCLLLSPKRAPLLEPVEAPPRPVPGGASQESA